MKLISIIFLFFISNFSLINFASGKLKLKNGSLIESSVQPDLPRQNLLMIFEGGAGSTPLEKQGIDSILFECLNEGPQNTTSQIYREKLYHLHGEIDFSQTPRATFVSITAPVKTMPETLALFKEILKFSRLNPETFEGAKERVLSNTTASFQRMQKAISYFGIRDAINYHPDLLDGTSAPNTIKALTFNDLKPTFDKIFDFSHFMVAGIGPMKEKVIKQNIEKIFSDELSNKNSKYTITQRIPINPEDVKPSKLKVALLNKPGATDHQILYIFPEDLKLDTKERAIAIVTHRLLGGGMTGKLGEVLRVQRGLTYGASSYASQNTPIWYISTFGGDQQIKGLLEGINEVIANFKKSQFTPQEVDQAKMEIESDWRSEIELPQDKLMKKIKLKLFGLNPLFVDQFSNYLSSIKSSDIQLFTAHKINMNNGYLYLMGDKNKILPILKELGFNEAEVKLVEMKDLK